MWNLSFAPPTVVHARVLTRLPESFRKRQRTAWADANKPGHELDSFLEGPTFDPEGNLWVVDIPNGRIFRITPALEWSLAARYDGWPNGLALHPDGSLWIADYRRGLLRLDRSHGTPTEILGHRNSESFKGLNDLVFDAQGNCWFTDQGQTGLHDPSGRVYRYGNGQLCAIVSGIPSPNGLAVDSRAHVLYVAVTRANQLWRAPILPDGSVSKMGAFRTFFGASGPDGMALAEDGRIVMCHASLGGAFVMNPRGEVTHFVKSPVGSTVTNVALRPGASRIVLTESETGTILEADLP